MLANDAAYLPEYERIDPGGMTAIPEGKSVVEYDVVVVGLGVMGSAAAYHLSQRGERVLGLDAYPAGHTNGSSHGESRIIRLAYYEHPDYNPLLARAYDLWTDLEREVGERLFFPSGGLMLGRPDDELVAESIAAIRRQEREHEVLNAGEIRRRYPVFRPDDDEIALFDPRMGILFADRCLNAFRRLAIAHGAVLRDEMPVRGWTATEGGVEVWTDGERFRAARLIVTAGPWIGKMLPELALPIGIERIPVFYWEPRESPESFALGRFPVFMWERRREGVFYGFPHLALPGVKAGRHHNEDWCDPDTVERVVTAADEQLIRDFFAGHLPALNGEVVERYACLYTTTSDQHFLIDRHPAHANVCYASSCSGHGFKFAPVVGEVLADLALTGETVAAARFLRGERLGVGVSPIA